MADNVDAVTGTTTVDTDHSGLTSAADATYYADVLAKLNAANGIGSRRLLERVYDFIWGA